MVNAKSAFIISFLFIYPMLEKTNLGFNNTLYVHTAVCNYMLAFIQRKEFTATERKLNAVNIQVYILNVDIDGDLVLSSGDL